MQAALHIDDEEGDDMDLAPEETGQGINRFANMMKCMTSRIEMFNKLGRIQDIGRHQQRGDKKKQKNKKGEDEGSEGHMDDKFYNLDDDFIDDGDLEGIDEDDEGSLFAETSKFMSGDPSEMGEDAKQHRYQ